MTPLRYTAHDGRQHYHRSHIAAVAMSLGFLCGVVSGVLLRAVRPLESKDTVPTWKRGALVCLGSQDTPDGRVFFVRNVGQRDYVWPASGELVLMADTGKGLARAPEGVTMEAPQFIPAGDTGVVTVTGDRLPDGKRTGLVMFDLRRHERVALR